MKYIAFTIMDSNNIVQKTGTLISFNKEYDESSFKSILSLFSGIPIQSIKNLYYNSNIGLLKYNNYSFGQKARVYAEVSDSYFLNQRINEETNRLREEYEKKFIGNKRLMEELDYKNLELERKNQELERKIQNEMEIRQREEQKIYNFKIAFEESKKNIEKINLEKSKEYITKFIINKYVKEFDNEEGKKNVFTNSLIKTMKNFNEKYMVYCSKFINSFKTSAQKIVNEFNIKDNKILIEHINFIVIGKAGVGKSVFINESLLLSKGKKAEEGIGQSVTKKSSVYESDKLKMVRMWDTQGLDYKISLDFILNEVNRIVENGLKQGPDHYINIILYCTSGERFQDEDAQLIYEIMKLYPSDNLPVIITQLQAYLIERAKNMEKAIRRILYKYLDKSIVDKIEIRDIVAREERGKIEVFEARGIPELLKLSVELMGRSITSATCKKFSQEIEKLCKNFVKKQINFIEQQFKYEMEILDVSKSLYVEDMEDLLENSEKKQIKTLSKYNIYSKIEDKNYFEDNFIKIVKTKFVDIYNNLNDTHILQENEQGNHQLLVFIENSLQDLKKSISKTSQTIFEEIFKKNFQDYLSDLQKEQSSQNKKFGVNCQVIDVSGTEKAFKEELFTYFNNVFFKNIFCIVLKLFMNNFKKKLIDLYTKELKENEKMRETINNKAKDSLKYITKKLQESLLKELNENFEEKKKKNNKPVDEFSVFDDNDSGF